MNKLNFKKLNSQKILTILSFVGVYLLVSGASWIVFSSLNKNTSTPVTSANLDSARSKIDTSGPKTEECPINGGMFTKVEKDIWSGRRPLTAVIENHLDSRPPSGVGRADVVYEAVAEGGITRFLNVFYCGVASGDTRIGPIRSARVYFINWASEYGKTPLFLHVGGANSICSTCPGGVKPAGQVSKEVNAFDLLISIGWRYANGNAMDGGTNVGYPVVWRDYERIPGAATEHTFMGSSDKLFEEGAKRGFSNKDEKGVAWDQTFKKWKFIDNQPVSPGAQTAENISFEFWSNKPDYNVEWKYDKATNTYVRFNGGKEYTDMETKQPITAKNVIITFLDERGPVDKEGHMFYKNVGRGNALFFQNGIVIKGTWSKDTREARTLFSDEKGKEISLVRGQVWIEGVPAGNEIQY